MVIYNYFRNEISTIKAEEAKKDSEEKKEDAAPPKENMQLLSEIEVLSWSLTATVAATRIQGFVRRRWYSLALIRNAKAMRALVMEAQSSRRDG